MFRRLFLNNMTFSLYYQPGTVANDNVRVASIPALLDQLEKLGANVEQLRKLYASGRQVDALKV
jgi:hypothetical protein